jgi:membrane protein
MPLRAIFFDIDGTLVDSNEFHVIAWDEAFREAGLITQKKYIRGQIGKGSDQLIPSLFPDTSQEVREAVSKHHGAIFRARYRDQVKPFPNAADLIEMLHAAGKTVILASSAKRQDVDYYVDLLKVVNLITGTVSQDDVTHSKPQGDIFAAALALVFPKSASETMAVGDSPYDVEAALRSQIRTVALRSGGFSEEALTLAGATHVYGSVKEIFDNFRASPLNN